MCSKRVLFRLCGETGVFYKEFPLRTEVDEFEGPYLEVGDNGSIAIVARDRGHECMRKETRSPEELARRVFELFNSR